ncbi:MAG: nucleotidyltransferase domain-containing protein [Patescibacteria group bacterium]
MTLHESYQKEISSLTKVIKERYQPEKIILFGSAARGELRQGSDIDMLIIKDAKGRSYDRMVEVLRLVQGAQPRLPFTPIVLTRQEYTRGLQEGRYFFRQIEKEGKVLYEPS